MKIVFISPDLYQVVMHIKNVLDKTYKNNLEWSNSVRDALRHPYIIVKLSKLYDDQVFLPFPKEIEYFRNIRIVETDTNFYMSIPMDIVIRLMYEEEKPYFSLSEKIKSGTSYFIPNLFDKTEFDKWTNRNRFVDVLERTLSYLFLINDMRYLNREYLKLIGECDDLTKEEINKLFRVTVRILTPIHKVLKFAKIKDIIIDYNDYANTIENLLNDRINLSRESDLEISSLLHRISIKDEYTDRGIMFKFKTSVNKLISFIQENIRSYGITHPEIIDILPVTTLVDAFITVDLETLKSLSNDFREFNHIIDLVCHKNNIMSFALKDTKLIP